jgi:hypothetical protein
MILASPVLSLCFIRLLLIDLSNQLRQRTMPEYHPDINDPNVFVLYRYRPSLAAAVLFIILFLLTTLFHTLQIWRKRTWYFIPLVIGGICTASPY